MCVPYSRINLDKWEVLSVLNKDWEDAELIHAISGKAALLLRNKELYFVGKWIRDANNLSTLPTEPIKIKKMPFGDIRSIASGIDHAVILSNKGFISTFGVNNKFGQLGVLDGSCLTDGELLVHNPTLPAIIKDICCGKNFTLALDNNGMVWFWGSVSSKDPVLENPVINSDRPFRLGMSKIVKISASASRAAALDQSGKVYMWDTMCNWPKISALDSLVVRQIACGEESLCVLTNENKLFRFFNGPLYKQFGFNEELKPTEPDYQFNYLTTNSNIFVARSVDGLLFLCVDRHLSKDVYRKETRNILECFANTNMPGVCLPRNEESASVSGEDFL